MRYWLFLSPFKAARFKNFKGNDDEDDNGVPRADDATVCSVVNNAVVASPSFMVFSGFLVAYTAEDNREAMLLGRVSL